MSIKKSADKIVGDYVLGGIGRAGYHLGKLPGVGNAGAYIRDNIREGFLLAEESEQKKIALHAITSVVNGGRRPTPEEIENACLRAGIKKENLDAVKAAAEVAIRNRAEMERNISEARARSRIPQEDSADASRDPTGLQEIDLGGAFPLPA